MSNQPETQVQTAKTRLAEHTASVDWLTEIVQALLAIGTVGGAFYYGMFIQHVDPTVLIAQAAFVLGYYFARATGNRPSNGN